MTANRPANERHPVNPTQCTVTNCQSSPATSQPIPLCAKHGVETALAVLPLALAGTLAGLADQTDDLAELRGRVGRHWRQAQINAVHSWIQKAGDPKAVSLEDVMNRLSLTQTTAYDRLVTAQRLYAEAQNPKSEKTA
jgi:hypothetical protein